MDYLITSRQTLSAARRSGLSPESLNLSGVALVTFSQGVIQRLNELCRLEDVAWISPRVHPYAAARVVRRGEFEGLSVTAVVPPMGASPLACVVEDLVTCGVQAVFLVCSAWSLGAPVGFGDLIVPSFSLGPDGTSIHYGNTRGEVHASSSVVDALTEACRTRSAPIHVGGNAACEALYRITPEAVDDFRRRRCLSMDNGEASALLAIAHSLEVVGGVLFQPYIDLTRGWEPHCLDDHRYHATCRLQAEVVLEATVRLRQQQLI